MNPQFISFLSHIQSFVIFIEEIMYDNFSFFIKPLALDEVSDIVSYDTSDVVADITDEEFLQGLKSQHQYEHEDELTRGLLDQLLGIKRPLIVGPRKKIPVRLPPKPKLKKPLQKSQPRRGKLAQFRSRLQNHFIRPPASISHDEPASLTVPAKRPKVPLRQLTTIKPLKDDLLDLLPPEPEELGVEMDKLLLDTPDKEDEDSDSVSLYSSDECSLYDANDPADDQFVQQLEKSNSRPGLELNLKLYGLPSRDEIRSLPITPIFMCDNIRCGYTTSNQTKIKLHSSTHSSTSATYHRSS